MSTLTRRQFLGRSGAFAALLGLPKLSAAEMTPNAPILGTTLGVPTEVPLLGRVFRTIEARTEPKKSAASTGRLPSDSLYAIRGVSEDGWWYNTPKGYVPREAMQPILPYARPQLPADLSQVQGFYNVIAPTVTVKSHCTGYASILGRVSFGAVMYVHDVLVDDHKQVWYCVSPSMNGSGLFGWASALSFSPWHPPKTGLAAPALWVDAAHSKLSVYDGEMLVGETAIHAGGLARGVGTLKVTLPASAAYAGGHYVRSWLMLLQGALGKPMPVYGAYWHNRFGVPHTYHNVELPPLAARWLYNMLGASPIAEIPVIIE
ncbi:MAG: hypothetical protein OHK0023_00350 [Anaerolineae bacterium]